ncbi:MAG: CPBP family intramembrane metalloprotease [Anaerolineales bacterium]|nr:CPBP family intramembrane metalloprotease [Anaerolineales bacterium]
MIFAIVLYLFTLMAVGIAVAFPSLGWLSPLTYVLLLPLGAVWGWHRDGLAFADLGCRFSAGWIRRLAAGLVVGLAIPALFLIVQALGGWITLAQRAESQGNFASYLLLILVKMFFIVGIEELAFRGFFIQSLGRKIAIAPAIILASLLWAAGHMVSMASSGISAGQIAIGMVSIALWGIALGICFLKTGKSLWLPFGIHFGINIAFSVLGWFFITTPNAPEWWIGHPAFAPETGLIGVAGWGILALGMYACFTVPVRKGSSIN